MDFRPLGHRTLVHGDPLIKQLASVRRHAVYNDGARAVTAAHQVGLSVLIPERTRILPLLHGFHEVKRFPRACGIGGRGHEQSFIGSAEIHIETSVMIAQRGSPRATCVVTECVPSGIVETVVYVAYDAPVEQVGRFQNRHTHEMEVGTYHIVAVADTYYVGIGVVGVEYRIDIRAVALIAPRLYFGAGQRGG